MGRHDRQLVRDFEVVQDIGGGKHDGQVRVGAHDHANKRLLVREAAFREEWRIKIELFWVMTARAVREQGSEAGAELRV